MAENLLKKTRSGGIVIQKVLATFVIFVAIKSSSERERQLAEVSDSPSCTRLQRHEKQL
jgi:hypothetical protein